MTVGNLSELQKAASPECAHCWHSNGLQLSHEFGGTEWAKCCDCGAVKQLAYRYVQRPIPKHGPHVTVMVKVYDEPAS